MSYILDLRRIVGNMPLIAVGATIVVRDPDGRILLNLRSDTNTWGIPGGAMEFGETIEETARRELLEETGLSAGRLKLLGVLSGPEFFFIYPNGDQLQGVCVLYEAEQVTGQPKPNDVESTAVEYFALAELPELESRAAAVIKYLPGLAAGSAGP